jgi:hypothetical protein
MSTVFVVFPPGSGGNHLRNIIVSCYKDTDILTLYEMHTKTVHFAEPGNNLQYNQIENAVSTMRWAAVGPHATPLCTVTPLSKPSQRPHAEGAQPVRCSLCRE